jgi:hypothetical protein
LRWDQSSGWQDSKGAGSRTLVERTYPTWCVAHPDGIKVTELRMDHGGTNLGD